MGSPRVRGCEAEQLWEGTLSISVPQFPQGELYVGRRRGEVAFIGALPTTVLHKHFLYPHSQLQAALGRRLMGDGVPCWGRSGGTGSAGSTVPTVLGVGGGGTARAGAPPALWGPCLGCAANTDTAPRSPSQHAEMELLGQDGHIYKGRWDVQLPALAGKEGTAGGWGVG